MGYGSSADGWLVCGILVKYTAMLRMGQVLASSLKYSSRLRFRLALSYSLKQETRSAVEDLRVKMVRRLGLHSPARALLRCRIPPPKFWRLRKPVMHGHLCSRTQDQGVFNHLYLGSYRSCFFPDLRRPSGVLALLLAEGSIRWVCSSIHIVKSGED